MNNTQNCLLIYRIKQGRLLRTFSFLSFEYGEKKYRWSQLNIRFSITCFPYDFNQFTWCAYFIKKLYAINCGENLPLHHRLWITRFPQRKLQSEQLSIFELTLDIFSSLECIADDRRLSVSACRWLEYS